MSVWDSLILGLLQGLTEFLPVSSSGHLALGSHLLHLSTPGLGFEVWLHIATLVAVLVALRRDVRRLLAALLPGARGPEVRDSRMILGGMILGTLPAVAVGLTLKDTVERAFHSPHMVGVGLLLTAVILTATRWMPERLRPLNLSRGFGVGCAQALAIFPGVSRSGSTLAAGLAVGLAGRDAARFSFLLSVPAILGASLLEAGSLVELGHSSAPALAVGFLAAAVSGFVAIQLVWRVMERGRLWIFAPYCAVVGILALTLL